MVSSETIPEINCENCEINVYISGQHGIIDPSSPEINMFYIAFPIALIWIAFGYELLSSRIRYEIKRRT